MPRFTIVAPDYEDWVPRHDMSEGIKSLAMQNFQDFELLVVHDGPKRVPYQQEADWSVFGDRVRFLNTSQRMNDWGHSSRDLGIRQSTGDYILNFNIDNHLRPYCLEYIDYKIKETETPVVIFSILHFGQAQEAGQTNFTGLPPKWGSIDALQLVARKSVWEEINFWHDRRRDSDGYLYEEIASKFHYEHIPHVLAENYGPGDRVKKLDSNA